jgi:iron(III) transport system substrate-binding protein
MRMLAALFLVFSCAALAQPADPSARIIQRDGAGREQFLAQGAKKEGEVSVYTSLISEDLTALSAAFEKKYGVKVKGWRAAPRRSCSARSPKRARPPGRDVIETNGPELESLYREKSCSRSSPAPAGPDAAGDAPHGHWVGTRINMFVHSYNTQAGEKDELPKSYCGPRQPALEGPPRHRGEDEDWFAMVVKELGEEAGLRTFREIARNGFSVRKGHTLLAGLVASGEVPFALTTYSHGAEKMKQKGAPVEWFAIPPAIGRANGVAIAARPAHPHAAALFVDFILSPEGQKILEHGGYVPANVRLGSPQQKLPLKFVDPAVVLDEDAKWKKLFAEIVLGNAAK